MKHQQQKTENSSRAMQVIARLDDALDRLDGEHGHKWVEFLHMTRNEYADVFDAAKKGA